METVAFLVVSTLVVRIDPSIGTLHTVRASRLVWTREVRAMRTVLLHLWTKANRTRRSTKAFATWETEQRVAEGKFPELVNLEHRPREGFADMSFCLGRITSLRWLQKIFAREGI